MTLDDNGLVMVKRDDGMMTMSSSTPGVFAVGDVATHGTSQPSCQWQLVHKPPLMWNDRCRVVVVLLA